MEGSPESLTAWARLLFKEARTQGTDGYIERDDIKVRKAAQRAWKAACAATDAAMAARGIPRDGTESDRARHYGFLDGFNGGKHAYEYAIISDRLNRLCAHDGHLPSSEEWEHHMETLEAFLHAMATPPEDAIRA